METQQCRSGLCPKLLYMLQKEMFLFNLPFPETGKCGYITRGQAAIKHPCLENWPQARLHRKHSMQYEQRACLFVPVSKKWIWNISIALGVCSWGHHKLLQSVVWAPAVAYNLVIQILGELCIGSGYQRESPSGKYSGLKWCPSHGNMLTFPWPSLSSPIHCLQCFDTVGWAAGRASGL